MFNHGLGASWLIVAVVIVIPFWRICAKAGYSPWLGLLAVVPLVNLFLIYFLAVHWQQMRQQLRGFLLLAGSYFVGFGPLLFYFVRKPNLYYGRGASLMIWSPHIPTGLQDLGNTWGTLWPAISENLSGISTHS